jgi:uncharacterized protein (UPF0335 family)
LIETHDDFQALKEARRQSAAKVRALLEQLEEAEKEFAAISEQVRALHVQARSAGIR